MSKVVQPVTVGLFVFGALAVAIATLLFVGTASLFKREVQYLLYFDESINGLSIGAPVKFRGVPVGHVSDIRIRYNQAPLSGAIPVFINLDQRRIHRLLGSSDVLADPLFLRQQIAEGLRGRLQLTSIISGLLYVELDYFENPSIVPPRYGQLEKIHLEIPTEPSVMARFGATTTDLVTRLTTLDLEKISGELAGLLAELRRAVDVVDWQGISQSLTRASSSLDTSLRELDAGATAARLRQSLDQLDALTRSLQQNVSDGATWLAPAARQLQATLASVDASARRVEQMLAPGVPLRADLERTLRETAQTAASLRRLVEFIERNPQAILGGREPTP